MKAPAFQFYVRDWLTDTELSRCSPATRGIWMDMLAAMWVAPNRGKLDKVTFQELARITRCTAEEAEDAIGELERTGTASVTRNGKVTDCHKIITVESRRMVREDAERKANADRQKRHRDKASQESNAQSNAKVTRPSASAVSASASATTKQEKIVGSIELPEVLDVERFRTTWAKYVQHRKEKRVKLTPTAEAQALKKCEAWGVNRSIAAIEHSISNGWTGIFEPQAAANSPPPTASDAIALRNWDRLHGGAT